MWTGGGCLAQNDSANNDTTWRGAQVDGRASHALANANAAHSGETMPDPGDRRRRRATEGTPLLVVEYGGADEAGTGTPVDPASAPGRNPKDVAVCCGRWSVNHNVALNLAVSALFGTGNSLWNGAASSAYLQSCAGGRTAPLGYVQGASGLAALAASFPLGAVADRRGRAGVAAAGGVLLGTASVGLAAILPWLDGGGAGAWWTAGAVLSAIGVGGSVVRGPAAVLIADSTPEGERTRYYNYQYAAQTGSRMVGPLVSIAVFRTLGDVWDLPLLRLVVYVGLGFQVACSVLMLFFDDAKTLDEGDAAEREAKALPPIAHEPGKAGGDEERLELLHRRRRWIPYITFAHDVLLAVGSGMSVKFFPLFFKDEVGMSPSQVQVIYFLQPLLMIVGSTLATRLSASGFGRVQTTIAFNAVGVACLYAMVFFKLYLDVHPLLLVPVYLLRTAFVNCTSPLQTSILMDALPREARARWKSLDAVSGFGWSGSAAFGGWLADRFDYTETFLITALFQTAGVGVWALLLPLVPRTEGPMRRVSGTKEGPG